MEIIFFKAPELQIHFPSPVEDKIILLQNFIKQLTHGNSVKAKWYCQW